MHIIAIFLNGNIEDQIFQIATICAYANKYKRKICVNNSHLNEDLKTIINDYNLKEKEANWINIMEGEEFNKIPFYFHLERIDNQREIPDVNYNLCIQGGYKTIKHHDSKTLELIAKLFLNTNNDYYQIATAILDDIKNKFFTATNLTIMYLKKPVSNEDPDIIYYNNAIELLEPEERNVIVLSDDYEWTKSLLSINSNFHFVSNGNRCVQLILMMLVPVIITSNCYLSWWPSLINKTKVIVPKSSKLIKINNSICI